jgi:4-hydroxy-tetrahydrodipicolinate reductase
VNVALLGHEGKVGRALRPALERTGHEVTGFGAGETVQVAGKDAAIDFTTPESGLGNIRVCLEQGVPVVLGTSGVDLEAVDEAARGSSLPVFYAPNFALGAVLMMRFAEEAAKQLPCAEIVELHNEAKRDAPSGTAKATAERLPGETPIHSIRLPGLVAHQEVLLGGEGELLTIRHDTFSREAFAPGVLLALEKLRGLPAGLTVGLEQLL